MKNLNVFVTFEEFVRLFHRCEKYVLTLSSVKDSHEFFRCDKYVRILHFCERLTFVIRMLDMCDKFIKKSICNAFISRPPISLNTTLCREKYMFRRHPVVLKETRTESGGHEGECHG